MSQTNELCAHVNVHVNMNSVCGIVCCDMCSVCLHRDPSNVMLFVRNYFISFVNKFEDEKKALHKQTPNSVDK